MHANGRASIIYYYYYYNSVCDIMLILRRLSICRSSKGPQWSCCVNPVHGPTLPTQMLPNGIGGPATGKRKSLCKLADMRERFSVRLLSPVLI